MKKWLVFLLLVIAAAGTFIPCCQTDDCATGQVSSSTSENHDEPEGSCSPFFACATCPGFVGLSKHIQLVQPEQAVIVHYTEVISFKLSTYSASILQPPRLA